jgi:hypothetical protein
MTGRIHKLDEMDDPLIRDHFPKMAMETCILLRRPGAKRSTLRSSGPLQAASRAGMEDKPVSALGLSLVHRGIGV